MELRNVEPGDVEAYVRMRCDPTMMAGLRTNHWRIDPSTALA
jgi:hypothetical protein